MVSSSRDGRMTPDLAKRFEREALPHRDQLLRTALQLTRHRQDAEDLVQEAIERACGSFHRFTPGTNMRAWLHRIMLNAFINGYRKRQREPALMVPAVERLHGYAQAIGAVLTTASADDVVLAAMPAQRLVEALQELPAEFREVLYLIDVEGFRYREAAAIMNTPLGTVMSRLHRARTSLRVRLAPASRGAAFEPEKPGQRTGRQSQEVAHVERDNCGARRGGHSRHRADDFPHNGCQAPSGSSSNPVLNTL